ncbi:hypothetical protein GCM10029992_53990 [Glycomyces albus]
MPRPQRTIFRTLAPLAAVALGATACAEIEPLDTTGVYEVFTGSAEVAWCGPGDDARIFEGGADLVGPHFSLSLLCAYSGSAALEQATEAVPDLEDLPRLVGGAELLIDQVALAATYEPQAGGGDVSAWIDVDGERIDLESVPEPGDYLAVTVPDGEDAVLWIEDEGRAQGLDLRSGSQVEPVAAYYSQIGTGPVELDGYEYEEVRVVGSSGGYRLTCSSWWATAARSVWAADRGWAADGTVFLEVQFEWCRSFDSVEWRLDPEAAVTVVNGEETRVPIDWEEGDVNDGWATVTAWFEIPEDAAELTVAFRPVGGVEDDSGDSYAFVETPDATEWAVEF